MRYILLTLFLTHIWNFCLSQSNERRILIKIPEQSELKDDINNQLMTKWNQTDHKGIWNDEDVKDLVVSSSEPIFPEEYMERKFSKLGYRITWSGTSEPANKREFHLYGEFGKLVKIHKGGGQSVAAYLKVFNSNGKLITQGEPSFVYKKLKKDL